MWTTCSFLRHWLTAWYWHAHPEKNVWYIFNPLPFFSIGILPISTSDHVSPPPPRYPQLVGEWPCPSCLTPVFATYGSQVGGHGCSSRGRDPSVQVWGGGVWLGGDCLFLEVILSSLLFLFFYSTYAGQGPELALFLKKTEYFHFCAQMFLTHYVLRFLEDLQEKNFGTYNILISNLCTKILHFPACL